MANKTQRLKPDTILKNYWEDNGQFADLFNAVLFGGEQIITPEELEDRDTEESSVLEHREYTESLKASRDNIKIRKTSSAKGMEFVLLGNESQNHIHYAMPMRIMGYDYGAYKKQYDINAKKYQTADGLNADEFLSKMKKTDKLTPVITVVVYYGTNAWDGATSLHDMLDISEGMERFVNDYKMLLVEARLNNLSLHNPNNVDLFNLFGIVLDKDIPKNEAKEKIIQYCDEHKTDKAVIMTVAGAANIHIDYNTLSKKGDITMRTVFNEIAEEGEAKGIIEAGLDFGLSENDILGRLQKKINISLKKAQEYYEMFGKQTV